MVDLTKPEQPRNDPPRAPLPIIVLSLIALSTAGGMVWSAVNGDFKSAGVLGVVLLLLAGVPVGAEARQVLRAWRGGEAGRDG